MAEHPGPDFTGEELLQQAAGNWNAVFFAAVDYLREQGLSPEEFVRWLGERFAPGWDEMRGNLEQIAYFAAFNPGALGAERRGYDVREREVTIVTSTEHLDAPRAHRPCRFQPLPLRRRLCGPPARPVAHRFCCGVDSTRR